MFRSLCFYLICTTPHYTDRFLADCAELLYNSLVPLQAGLNVDQICTNTTVSLAGYCILDC